MASLRRPFEVEPWASHGATIVADGSRIYNPNITQTYPKNIPKLSSQIQSESNYGESYYESSTAGQPWQANNQLALAKQIVDESESPLPEVMGRISWEIVTNIQHLCVGHCRTV